MVFRKITIIRVKKPKKKNINEELQWFSHSLGLFSIRDKEKSCFRLFIELVKAIKNEERLSSDELAFKSNLSRATVIHHLNNLVDKGIVTSEKKRYLLRVDSLEELIFEIRQDLLKTLEELEYMAEELDKELGLMKKHKIYIG